MAATAPYAAEPDVYETAAVQSDNDTATPKGEESQSPIDSASDSDGATSPEDGPFGTISRKSFFPQRARSRFQAYGNKVDAKGLDLSDRVDGRRRGLRMRQRSGVGHDGPAETLDAKMARLKREIEECRVQASRPADDRNNTTTVKDVESLGQLLADLEVPKSVSTSKAAGSPRAQDEPDTTGNEQHNEQTLSRITAFDTRLASLERALGVASLDMAPDGSFTSPVVPSLDLLDQQMAALMTSASIAQLDAASSRVRKLTQDAEQFSKTRAQPVAVVNDDTPDAADGPLPATISQDDLTRLNALYALLPTLQGLAPTVPALLERMSSLTALHTGAANAKSELDAVEKRQADAQAEIKAWTDGLRRVEGVVAEASEANGRNGKMVQGWVKDLEGRLKSL